MPVTSAGGQIGRYHLIGSLATGGMAQVFLALSGELSGFRTLVVVKRVLPHLALNTQFIQMFFDEARIAALLDHPNIARIVEVGQDGEEYFLAMEVVQGRPLSAVLRRGVKRNRPFTHAQSAFVVAQAANGLGYAHNLADADGRQLNVVHRDVSPQNILVSFEGAVKVIDFGVARALGRVTETVPGGLKGKIHYMAPEQASAGQVDRRSDVFALGVVLWEALCGRRLFRRESEIATLRAIIEEPILAPSTMVRIAPRLEQIVMRALEKDPANRFQDAHEMALALERHAFATEGFNPPQIAAAMKDLFAADYTRWKRTVAAAMDLDGAPEQWSRTSGTFLRPQEIELRTRGSTVALHPPPAGTPAGSALGPRRREHPSDSRSASSDAFSLPDAPSGKRSAPATFGALVAALLLVPVGVWLAYSYRPTLNVTIVRPAASAPGGMTIEALALAPGPEPITANGGPLRPDPSLPPARAGEPPLTELATAPTPPVPERLPPAQSRARAKVGYDDLVAKFAAPTPLKTGGDTSAATRRAVPRQVRTVRAAKAGGRPVAPTPGRAATLPSTATPAVATSAAPPRARASGAGEDAKLCSIKLGSQPWSEVWIDGRNTGAHTPYVKQIACGVHKLTLKRTDLSVARSITITVRAGEPFKQTVRLDQE